MVNWVVFLATLGSMNLGSFKLENVATRHCVAELHNGKIEIFDFSILLEIKDKGIYIPPMFRSEFSGKTHVYQEDPDFTRAFIDVYYKMTLDPHCFKWSKF